MNYLKKKQEKYFNGKLMDTFRGYTGEEAYELCPLENNYLAVGYKSFTGKLGKIIRILNCDTGGLLIKLIGDKADVFALVKIGEKIN